MKNAFFSLLMPRQSLSSCRQFVRWLTSFRWEKKGKEKIRRVYRPDVGSPPRGFGKDGCSPTYLILKFIISNIIAIVRCPFPYLVLPCYPTESNSAKHYINNYRGTSCGSSCENSSRLITLPKLILRV